MDFFSLVPLKTIFMKILFTSYRYFVVLTIHFVDSNIIWKDFRYMKYM